MDPRHEVGIALQADHGSIASAPTYVWTTPDASLPLVLRDRELFPSLGFGAAQPSHAGTETWEAELPFVATPETLGLILKTLLSTETYTAGGVHTLKPGNAGRWLTLFSRRPGNLYERWGNGLAESVLLSFASGQPVEGELRAVGLAPERLASAYGAGARDDARQFVQTVGATVKLDTHTTPAATIHAEVESGAVRITRPVRVHTSAGGVTGVWLSQGGLEVEWDLRATLLDYDAWRTWAYGSPSGSTATATLAVGAVDLLFATLGVDDTLRVVSGAVEFQASVQAPSDAGEFSDLELTGRAIVPAAGGQVVQAVVTNDVLAAY